VQRLSSRCEDHDELRVNQLNPNRSIIVRKTWIHYTFSGLMFALLTMETSVSAGDLKVMTWNIDGGECGRSRKDLGIVASLAINHKVDVMVLQEIYYHQAYALGHALTPAIGYGYYWRFEPTKNCESGKGIAIFSRYRFGDSARWHYLPHEPHDEKRGELRKVLTVTIRVDGQLVHIYNTHLTAKDVESSEDSKWRVRQVNAILRIVDSDASRASMKFRAILLGDFNSEPGTSPYNRALSEFRDAWLLGPNNSGPYPFGRTHRDRQTGHTTRVDYIMLSKGSRLGVDRIGVLNTGSYSNHLPVIALLSFVDR
jgi:endonuclease/exonuclease/phosphatase family metal-dependent hydrolase